jgi:hypothetical protein
MDRKSVVEMVPGPSFFDMLRTSTKLGLSVLMNKHDMVYNSNMRNLNHQFSSVINYLAKNINTISLCDQISNGYRSYKSCIVMYLLINC